MHSKNELLSAAAEYKASVGLTGSVARGEDDEDSDIDFYVYKFAAVDDGGPVDILRATEFVERIRTVLSPFKVDVFPLPGWPLGPAHEETMRRDAIPLEDVFAK